MKIRVSGRLEISDRMRCVPFLKLGWFVRSKQCFKFNFQPEALLVIENWNRLVKDGPMNDISNETNQNLLLSFSRWGIFKPGVSVRINETLCSAKWNWISAKLNVVAIIKQTCTSKIKHWWHRCSRLLRWDNVPNLFVLFLLVHCVCLNHSL